MLSRNRGLWGASVWLSATALFMGLNAGCAGKPAAEEGRARLAGRYDLLDGRQPSSGVNPAFKSASLLLQADGSAAQTCEYRDGTRYESVGMKWIYRGDGNVHLSPLKDCSWVWDPWEGENREGPREPARHGASLVVEWRSQPNILMDPDLNVFYARR